MTTPPRTPDERVIVGGTPDRPLVSRDAAALWEGRALSWIRRHVEPVACHVKTGTLLLDADDVSAASATVQRRSRRVSCDA